MNLPDKDYAEHIVLHARETLDEIGKAIKDDNAEKVISGMEKLALIALSAERRIMKQALAISVPVAHVHHDRESGRITFHTFT